MKSFSLVLPALIVLAACDGGTQSADMTVEEAEASGNLVDNSSAAPAPTESAAATAIPTAMQGRWGLVAADCEPGRADAKGLLTIGAGKLEFYESVGTLDEIEESAPNSLRASFDFEGEGMEWEREMLLELADDGAVLVRREYGQDAAPGPLRYTKCGQGR